MRSTLPLLYVARIHSREEKEAQRRYFNNRERENKSTSKLIHSSSSFNTRTSTTKKKQRKKGFEFQVSQKKEKKGVLSISVFSSLSLSNKSHFWVSSKICSFGPLVLQISTFNLPFLSSKLEDLFKKLCRLFV